MDFLVHTVKLKPIIKDQIPGKLVTSGISDVATASVHSEKTWAKKWIMINYYYYACQPNIESASALSDYYE